MTEFLGLLAHSKECKGLSRCPSRKGVVGRIKQIEKARQQRLEQPGSESGPQAKVRLLARVVGIGIETAD